MAIGPKLPIGKAQDPTRLWAKGPANFPVWMSGARYTYAVKGNGPEDVWRQRKLEHHVYEEYLVLCRDGYISRKRTLDAIKEAELQAAVQLLDANLASQTMNDTNEVRTPTREGRLLILVYRLGGARAGVRGPETGMRRTDAAQRHAKLWRRVRSAPRAHALCDPLVHNLVFV